MYTCTWNTSNQHFKLKLQLRLTNLVILFELNQHRLTRHRISVVRLVILVVAGGNLSSVMSDRQQGLLHIVCADVDDEEIGSG